MNEQYKIGTEVYTHSHTHLLKMELSKSFDKARENRSAKCWKKEGDKIWAAISKQQQQKTTEHKENRRGQQKQNI